MINVLRLVQLYCSFGSILFLFFLDLKIANNIATMNIIPKTIPKTEYKIIFKVIFSSLFQ